MDRLEVSMHVAALRELALADRALVRLLSCVRPLVLRVRRVVAEGVRTVGALERPFSRVDAHVSRQ